MGMNDKVYCADGNHCMRGLFEQWDLNEDNICQGCEAVAYYIEGLAKEKDKLEPCSKCGSKTFLYDEHGDPVYCKECLNHVY